MSNKRKKNIRVNPLKNFFDNFHIQEVSLRPKIFNFSELAQSTRRIFHIFTDASLDESQSFRDIFFAHGGTGILIKDNLKYFLLTAHHVIKDYIENSPNTSPFRITNKSTTNFSKVDDFLYPKYFWTIGDIVEEHEYYDFKDAVIVELFHPLPDQVVDHFIDINKVQPLEINEFKEGMIAVDFGYSLESNPYFYEADNTIAPYNGEIHACSTKIHMDIINGYLKKDLFTFVFEKYNYLDLNTNGMSGGLIAGIVDGVARPLGMHLRGSSTSKQINFLPIAELFRAVKRRDESKKIIIDYCAHERLIQGRDQVSIGEMFFDWASKQSPDSLRSIKNNPYALEDDMCDFILANKEMLLAAEAEKEELGLLSNEDKEFGMQWFIEMHENYKKQRDKEIENSK
ncbi:hypothetical protein NCY62_01155 [Acinetobacter pittii]|uniref:hypothetical protein n=1 Tax=Acinetobacter pittii TaxID=48296 RepID=UPI00202F5701|nr:hypothetical protein [Acinetobacter pittii]MCM1961827.1 hypothetical protein [Acinetobacter pittii]MCM1978376.1 hypothetical protein [Acinetobacter pittii]